jgi:hypothetical protein
MANQIAVDKLEIGGQEVPAGWIQGSLAGDDNQIDWGTIGGGEYGNIGRSDSGISEWNCNGTIIDDLGFAIFSDKVFHNGETAEVVRTFYLVDSYGYHYGPTTVTINGTSYRIFAWNGGGPD